MMMMMMMIRMTMLMMMLAMMMMTHNDDDDDYHYYHIYYFYSPGCSIEVPQPASVANLRLSLFGGDKTSLEKLMSRGMGGVLSKSPVKLRTQQVTSERRQVMSSVEVSTNGVEALSTTRVSMRMSTKSESEVEVRK